MAALLLSGLGGLAGCTTEPAPAIPEGPVEWTVAVTTTSGEVQVGDDFTLTLTVTHPPGGDFVPPSAADLEPFEVLETRIEEVSPVETRLHFRLAAYQLPDELEVAPLSIGYRDDDGERATLETEPIPIRVVTSLTPDVTDIHDIKDPVALVVPRDWSLWLWLVVVLVASLLAYLIYWKLRKNGGEHAAPTWAPPPEPPHEEAEAALARLKDKGLVEKGEIARFYTELTDIMKRYAGRRFEVPYLERTTEEILADLADKDVSLQPRERLRAILELADLVKFAKQMPDRRQASSSLTMAFELVRDTRPAAPTPELEATA